MGSAGSTHQSTPSPKKYRTRKELRRRARSVNAQVQNQAHRRKSSTESIFFWKSQHISSPSNCPLAVYFRSRRGEKCRGGCARIFGRTGARLPQGGGGKGGRGSERCVWWKETERGREIPQIRLLWVCITLQIHPSRISKSNFSFQSQRSGASYVVLCLT